MVPYEDYKHTIDTVVKAAEKAADDHKRATDDYKQAMKEFIEVQEEYRKQTSALDRVKSLYYKSFDEAFELKGLMGVRGALGL